MGDVQYITSDLACPICKYNLRGLPIDHACPECGLKIDRHVSFDDPHGKKRDRLIEEFDSMMEEREKLERAAQEAAAFNDRQARLIARWEQLSDRFERLMDAVEQKMSR
jgi:predicted nuclease with TOPRIM domain